MRHSSMSNLSEAQIETYNGLATGISGLNKGSPCECGPDDYNTTSTVGYSDFVTYKHRCRNCGNQFETWTEG